MILFVLQGPNFAISGYLTKIKITNLLDINGHRYASVLYTESIKFDYTGLYVCRLAQDANVNNSVFIFAAGMSLIKPVNPVILF